MIKQLNEYQIECKEKDNIISEPKLKEIEISEQLNDEIKPADGMQDLVEKQSLENMKLNDEIELLKQQINKLKESESLMDNVMEFRTRSSANIKETFKPFNLSLEYVLKHLSNYKNDSNNLLLIWNVVDANINHQIIVNTQNLNIILKEFIIDVILVFVYVVQY